MIAIGDTYRTTATLSDKGIWQNFGIHPSIARAYGRRPEDIHNVEITVKDIDISVIDWYKNNDSNALVYFGYYDYEHGYRHSLMRCNIKVYNVCFPYGADNACFRHDNGKRTNERIGTTFIFDVKEV